MKGVDLRTVQELAGHKTIGMTVRYAHLAPEHNQAAIERLDPVETKTRKRSQSGARRRPGRRNKIRLPKLAKSHELIRKTGEGACR
jgi:hypothetical protein